MPKGGRTAAVRRTILKASGQVLHALTRDVPDLGEDGIIAGFSAVVTDITEQKITETKLALAASVFDSTVGGIMVGRALSKITPDAVEDVAGQPDRIFRPAISRLT